MVSAFNDILCVMVNSIASMGLMNSIVVSAIYYGPVVLKGGGYKLIN